MTSPSAFSSPALYASIVEANSSCELGLPPGAGPPTGFVVFVDGLLGVVLFFGVVFGADVGAGSCCSPAARPWCCRPR